MQIAVTHDEPRGVHGPSLVDGSAYPDQPKPVTFSLTTSTGTASLTRHMKGICP
jgi:hypothetical protein